MNPRMNNGRRAGAVLAAVALLSVCPGLCLALGLGQVQVESALNESFRARIPLTDTRALDAADIKVSLATPEKFAAARVHRSDALLTLVFTVKELANGDKFIEVTSRQPMREPALEFLLQVVSTSGTMLQKYTVLLSPPGTPG